MTTNVQGSESYRQKKFSGRTVLVTGAAGDSQYAAAKLFFAEGARLMLCDLSTTELNLKQRTAELLSQDSEGSSSAIYACGDVSNVDDVKKWVQQCVDEFGGIDVLFNGAITVPVGPLQLTDEAVFKKSQDYDVYGTFLMMKYVSSKMIESGKGGVILNMSGYAGLRGVDVLFPYCASRFAINGMTRAAAKSLAKHKIRVCAIAPNMIEGSTTEEGLDGLVDLTLGPGPNPEREKVKAGILASILQNIPLGRTGQLSEFSETVLFLCSDQASYITGVVFPLDGGSTA